MSALCNSFVDGFTREFGVLINLSEQPGIYNIDCDHNLTGSSYSSLIYRSSNQQLFAVVLRVAINF